MTRAPTIRRRARSCGHGERNRTTRGRALAADLERRPGRLPSCPRATPSTGPPTGSGRPSSASRSCASKRRGRPPRWSPGAGHRGRRRRSRRQAPADPLRRRRPAAHPPAHDRDRGTSTEPASGGRGRPTCSGRWSRCPAGWRCASPRPSWPSSTTPSAAAPMPSPTSAPTSPRRPHRRRPRRLRRAHGHPRRARRRDRRRCCSTSASPAASATCTRARCCGPAGSTRSRRSAHSTPTPAAGSSRPQPKLLRANVAAGGPRATHARRPGRVRPRRASRAGAAGHRSACAAQGEQARAPTGAPTCQPTAGGA